MRNRRIVPALATLLTGLALVATNGCGSPDTGSPPTAPAKASAPAAKAKPKPAQPDLSVSQQNALRSAGQYLAMSGFSRKGLIEQLSSEAGEGYPVKDATWAVDHVKADWNEQAVRSAKEYLKMTPFSRKDLIEQLSSAAGEGYTVAQATYAADKVGL